MKRIVYIMLSTLFFGTFAGHCLAVELLGVDIHGFASQGYIKTTNNNFFGETENGAFDFNEIGINFGKDFSDKLHLGFQVLSRDFGSNGNNDVTLDWGFADYRWKDWMGVRAGKLKAAKGLYNETRDLDMLRTTIFLPQSVYPEILREMDLGLIGGGIYGYVGLGNMGGFSYQFMCGTQDIEANESASQALQGTAAIFTPMANDGIDVDMKYAAGLIYYTPLEGLRVSGTFDTSKPVASGHFTEGMIAGTPVVADFEKYENFVLSAEYTLGDLIVAAEYIRTKKVYHHVFGEVSDLTALPPPPVTPEGNAPPSNFQDKTADGWYLSSSYQFTDRFSLGAYYSESYNDSDDRNGDTLRRSDSVYHRAYFKDICLTTAFTIMDDLIVKLEGHRFNGTNGVSPLDQVPDENDEVFADGYWNLFAAKVTFSF